MPVDGGSREQPIGIFDSGVGGLSVLREIRRQLPGEELIYVADSAYAPYGDQPNAVIEARSIAIAQFLRGATAKAIVVACNTATGVAVDALRSRFSIPVVAIEPAVKPAAMQTKTAVIGVLATRQTLASEKFSKLLQAHGRNVRVLLQACPGLVEQVEKGDLTTSATRSLIEQYVAPLLQQGADTLVLGCTHYPFLAALVREVSGPSVTIIDPSAAVARELHHRLEANQLLSSAGQLGSERFWTSGEPEKVQPVIAHLWTGDVKVERLTSVEGDA